MEELLSDIRREREAAASSRRAEELARGEAEEIRRRLEEKLDAADEERDSCSPERRKNCSARSSAFDGSRVTLRSKSSAKSSMPPPRASAKREEIVARAKVRSQARRGRGAAREPHAPRVPAGPPPSSIREGDHVWLRGMDRFGEALGEPDARGEVELRMGPLRTRIKLAQVERVQRPAPSEATGSVRDRYRTAARCWRRDRLRGQTIDDAMPQRRAVH